MTDYTKPQVSPEDMDKIERRHEKLDAEPVDMSPLFMAAHHDRGQLIKQLNYTAAVIIDLQLQLADLKGTLQSAQRWLGEA